MLTIDQLAEYGANTKEGLARCMNMPEFYLRLVRMLAQDTHLAGLKAALDAGQTETAFEEAHALKGVLANLSLTPALDPISEITETLRPVQNAFPTLSPEEKQKLSGLYAEAERQMSRLLEMING